MKKGERETRPLVPRMPGRSEADEQMEVIIWASYMTGKYPMLERLYHTPNGGYRNVAEAAHFKRMGVRPGVPDLFLPYPCGGWSGLWLEGPRYRLSAGLDRIPTGCRILRLCLS